MRRLSVSLPVCLVGLLLASSAFAQLVTRGAPRETTVSRIADTSGDPQKATFMFMVKDVNGNILTQRPATKEDGEAMAKAVADNLSKATGRASGK